MFQVVVVLENRHEYVPFFSQWAACVKAAEYAKCVDVERVFVTDAETGEIMAEFAQNSAFSFCPPRPRLRGREILSIGSFNKFSCESLCKLTIDKIPLVWYNLLVRLRGNRKCGHSESLFQDSVCREPTSLKKTFKNFEKNT